MLAKFHVFCRFGSCKSWHLFRFRNVEHVFNVNEHFEIDIHAKLALCSFISALIDLFNAFFAVRFSLQQAVISCFLAASSPCSSRLKHLHENPCDEGVARVLATTLGHDAEPALATLSWGALATCLRLRCQKPFVANAKNCRLAD